MKSQGGRSFAELEQELRSFPMQCENIRCQLPHAGKSLSSEEANELMDKYDYLFANPNVVSLDYRKPVVSVS